MFGQLCSALQPCVAEVTDLEGVELIPPVIVELCVKIGDELGADEIDEGITNIAVVLYRQSGTQQSMGMQKKSNLRLCLPQKSRISISWVYLLGMLRTITVVRPSAYILSGWITKAADSQRLMARRLRGVLPQQYWLCSIEQVGTSGRTAQGEASVRDLCVYLSETGLELCSVSSVMTLRHDLTTAFTYQLSSSLSSFLSLDLPGSSWFSYSKSRRELLNVRWGFVMSLPLFLLVIQR